MNRVQIEKKDIPDNADEVQNYNRPIIVGSNSRATSSFELTNGIEIESDCEENVRLNHIWVNHDTGDLYFEASQCDALGYYKTKFASTLPKEERQTVRDTHLRFSDPKHHPRFPHRSYKAENRGEIEGLLDKYELNGINSFSPEDVEKMIRLSSTYLCSEHQYRSWSAMIDFDGCTFEPRLLVELYDKVLQNSEDYSADTLIHVIDEAVYTVRPYFPDEDSGSWMQSKYSIEELLAMLLKEANNSDREMSERTELAIHYAAYIKQ